LNYSDWSKPDCNALKDVLFVSRPQNTEKVAKTDILERTPEMEDIFGVCSTEELTYQKQIAFFYLVREPTGP